MPQPVAKPLQGIIVCAKSVLSHEYWSFSMIPSDIFFQNGALINPYIKAENHHLLHDFAYGSGDGFLISTAYAQTGGAATGADFFGSFLLPLLLIFVVFYFLLIRPQNKKLKEHRQMIEALRRGDKVVTGGGIIGSISKVDNDAEITVEIAEKVRVKVLRHTITEVLNKPQPVNPSTKTPAKTTKTTRKRTGSTRKQSGKTK